MSFFPGTDQSLNYPIFTQKLRAPPHLDGVGVVLWAANHSGGPVEAGRGLEGDGEAVGLRDVLHGGGAGVRLHDGGKLERQHERKQLLQYGGAEREMRKPPACWNTAAMIRLIDYHDAASAVARKDRNKTRNRHWMTCVTLCCHSDGWRPFG